MVVLEQIEHQPTAWLGAEALAPPPPPSQREQWLNARRTGIGGSDVAAILGLSKWKTPLQVYQEKRGEMPDQPDNAAMRWGRYLEPVVRQAYADETGRVVRMPTEMLRHPQHEFMLANLDGFAEVQGERVLRGFEAKTARTADGWGEAGSDEIPQPYLLQVQHYMAVTALHVFDVAVLIGGSDFRVYEVPADRELQGMLIDAEAEFWARVQRAEPPEPVTVDDAIARWGRASRAENVLADDEAHRAIAALKELKTEGEHHELAVEQWRAVLMRKLGERDTLVDKAGRVLLTWKASAAPQRFDSTTFKRDHPGLCLQYTKPGEPSRRFLLK